MTKKVNVVENGTGRKMIDDKGRIVLPPEVWAALGWDNRATVEIWVNPTEDEIVLHRRTESCFFCGSKENVVRFIGRPICQKCRKAIADL